MDDYFDNVDSTEINLKYFTEHHESIYKAYEKYGQLVHGDRLFTKDAFDLRLK